MHNRKGGLMKRNSVAWALIVAVVAVGCVGTRATDRIVTEDGGSFVRVERDRSEPRGGGYGHPVTVSLERLRAFLGAIEIESHLGPFTGEMRKEPLFDERDLGFLAPGVVAGLEQARPDEHVVFYLRQSGRLLRPEITTGAMAVTGDAISFTLGHYRRTDVEGVVQEESQANLEHEARADPMFRVFDRNVRLFVQADQPGRVDDKARTILFPRTGTVSSDLPASVVQAPSRSGPSGGRFSKEPPEPLKAQLPAASIAGSPELQELKTRLHDVEVQNAGLRQSLDELNAQMAEREAQIESLRRDLELVKKAIIGETKKPGMQGKTPRK